MRFRKIFGQEAMVRYLAADPVDLETSRLLFHLQLNPLFYPEVLYLLAFDKNICSF